MEEVLLIHLIYQLVECINMVWFICVLVHHSLSIHLSIHSSISPPIYLSIHPSNYVYSSSTCIYPSTHLFIHLFIYPSICLFIHLHIYISIQSCLHFWRLHSTTTRWCLSWTESHTITPNGIYWTEPYTTPNGISWTESHAISNEISWTAPYTWTEFHTIWNGTSSKPTMDTTPKTKHVTHSTELPN